MYILPMGADIQQFVRTLDSANRPELAVANSITIDVNGRKVKAAPTIPPCGVIIQVPKKGGFDRYLLDIEAIAVYLGQHELQG